MSAAMLIEVYSSVNHSTQRIQDQMLLAQAYGISENALNTMGDLVLLETIQQTSNDTVFYKVMGPGNAFVIGYGGLPAPPPGVHLIPGEPVFFNGAHRGRTVRVVALRVDVQGHSVDGPMTVYVAQTTDAREALVVDQVRRFSLRLGILILVAGGLAWLAVSRGLEPLTRLERAVARRSAADLTPIEVVLPREVTNLGAAINELFARLRESIARNRRFVANASHQLRTPVAGLMAQTELLLRDPGGGAELPARIHAAAGRLSRLIGQLLSLARAEGEPGGSLPGEPLDLARFARELTAECVPAALERGLDLGCEGESSGVMVYASPTLMAEMLRNLVGNACLYCPRGSHVTVRVVTHGAHALLEVIDDGPGIAPGDRTRVLERFARLDEANVQGTGLGLPIAAEVAQAHRGRLSLDAAGGGRGLRVCVELPLAAAD